jgi:N-acetylglucosamine-6-phosphate deacetylase
MLTTIINAAILTGNEKITGKAVVIKDKNIADIIDIDRIPKDAEIIDCHGDYLAPGLLDIQVAGGGGFLFSAHPSVEALEAMASSITAGGTTGFLIAVPTDTFEVYRKVIDVVKNNPHPALLGLHIEGPYISQHRRGAHMRNLVRHPQLDELKTLVSGSAGAIKMMTVAPEICTPDVIKFLNDNGIVVAAGHSNATFREAVTGFQWGIRTTTHLFNAMSQLHHRDPGLPGAAFLTKGVYASIIADGIHVDYNVVRIAKNLMGERLLLISDAVEENFEGPYQHVRKEDRFVLPDGTLSGSRLTMLKAVANCVKHVGIPIHEAIRMASSYPAGLLGIPDRGSLTPGFRADLVGFDEEFNVRMVMIGGELIKHI